MHIVFSEPIGISSALQADFERRMTSLGHTVTFYDQQATSNAELAERICTANILVLANQPLPAAAVELATQLQFIAVAFTGVDHLPLELCTQRGIAVANAAGYSTQAVAELTIATTIDLLRQVVPLDTAIRRGEGRNGRLGNELRGRTFGIVGLGAIGQRVAMLAQAFGCRVIAHNRSPKQCPGVELMPMEQLFAKADVVSLHIPATPQTAQTVDAKLIGLMKPTALLINTARGSVIDYSALAEALNNGNIAGAAIDVYEQEPPIPANHPMLKTPNTLLLPHIGFATHEAIAHRAQIVIDNIDAWLNGKSQNIVNE